MTKNAYLSELADRLRQLPQSEIDKSIAYYSEIIDDRMEEGCSEEEAVNGLEAPVTAASEKCGGNYAYTKKAGRKSVGLWSG